MAPNMPSYPALAGITGRVVPIVGINTNTAEPSAEVDERFLPIIILGIAYAILGVITYIFVNKYRLFALPEWYKSSDRGRTKKVLLSLWFPTIITLWPIVFASWLAAKCCSRYREKLTAVMKKSVPNRKGFGVASERENEQRDGTELVRWVEVPLDEEQAAVSRSTTTHAAFANLSEGIDRPNSRNRSPEASTSGSLEGRTSSGSAVKAEQPQIAWYRTLPSPAELQKSLTQTPSISNGNMLSSRGTGLGHSYSDNGNDNSSVRPQNLPTVIGVVIDADPRGKAKTLQRLETITESDVEGLEY